MLFLDGGLRLSELAGLQVADVDLRDRIVYVAGKGRPALSADGVDATLKCRGADAGIADPHPQRLAQPRHARWLRQDGRR
jgi:integrase